MTTLPLSEVVSNATRPPPASHSECVTRSLGCTIFENRTANRFSRVGSSLQNSPITAREQNAIVHSPWTMIPGSPIALAMSSSRWIGIGSPDAWL